MICCLRWDINPGWKHLSGAEAPETFPEHSIYADHDACDERAVDIDGDVGRRRAPENVCDPALELVACAGFHEKPFP
jgi:hypothetical protein